MKYTRKCHQKRSLKLHKSKRQSKRQRKYPSKHPGRRQGKHKSRRYLKLKGGNNGLVQLGYNTTRGITSTIKNFINTYIGNTPSLSPQATKSQYQT
tara:strand:+ start:596 stop:883 length:288 start_codon:yes stop_codon:yes gene_type:complete